MTGAAIGDASDGELSFVFVFMARDAFEMHAGILHRQCCRIIGAHDDIFRTKHLRACPSMENVSAHARRKVFATIPRRGRSHIHSSSFLRIALYGYPHDTSCTAMFLPNEIAAYSWHSPSEHCGMPRREQQRAHRAMQSGSFCDRLS